MGLCTSVISMESFRTFQFYAWADIAGTDLVIAPNGITHAQ